jgi:hypothetical protein
MRTKAMPRRTRADVKKFFEWQRIEDIPSPPWLLPPFRRGMEIRTIPTRRADKKSPDHRRWYTIMRLEESGLVVQVTDEAWALAFVARRAALLETQNGRPN